MCFGNLAGAEGFEPPKAVLETAGLPLAYAPNFFVRPSLRPARLPVYLNCELLGFPVRVMLAAVRAEFLHFQPACRGFLVLGAGVIAVLTLAALERNDFSWHLKYLPLTQNL